MILINEDTNRYYVIRINDKTVTTVWGHITDSSSREEGTLRGTCDTTLNAQGWMKYQIEAKLSKGYKPFSIPV